VSGSVKSLLLVAALAASASVSADAARVPEVMLAADAHGVLPNHLLLYDGTEILADPAGRWSFEDVKAPGLANQFVPNGTEIHPLGRRVPAVWLRFRLTTRATTAQTAWLSAGTYSEIDVFVANGTAARVARTGRFVPLSERTAVGLHPFLLVAPIDIPAGETTRTFYVRLAGDLRVDEEATRVVLSTALPRWATGRSWVYIGGIFFGLMVGIGLYHLVLFVVVRERLYLLFALANLCIALVNAGDKGLLLELVWPGSPRLDYIVSQLYGPLWALPFYFFAMAYLQTRQRTPKLHWAMVTAAASYAVEPLLIAALPRPLWLLVALYIAALAVPLVVAIAVLRAGGREARVFLAGYSPFFVVSALVALGAVGVGSDGLWMTSLQQAALALVSILFAWALALHIKALRHDKAEAEQREAFKTTQIRQRELESAQLASQLSQVRLSTLEAQLQPHFLFNVLNSISALMRIDIAMAERKLTLLSELLRLALEERPGHEAPFEHEVAFVERYLEIEKTRFPQRLSVEWQIEPATLRARVPHLLLQPLVENAVRHGIVPRSQPGTVWITAMLVDGRLRIEVRDDGVGPGHNLRPGGGIGLSNTRARLQNLYGDAAEFSAGAAPGGGFLVTISLPYQVDETAGAAGITKADSP
jgi:signal transduction histidine kinase